MHGRILDRTPKKLPFTCTEDLRLSCVSEVIFFFGHRINMLWSAKHGIYMYTVMFGHKKAQDKRKAKSGVLNLHFYMITPFTTALTATYFFTI